MRDIFTMIKDWWSVKVAANPNPSLEAKIQRERTKLCEQVSLLRLTESEFRQTRVQNRFAVMDDLIHDIARR